MATLTKRQIEQQATKETGAITPNAIAQAKARAVELSLAAYAPQPVKQPDGSTLPLCWNGRIARGYEKLAVARAERHTALIQTIQTTLRGFEQQYNAAANAAEQAASTWAAMAAAAGITVDPTEVYPPPCDCEGCRMQRLYHDHNEARGAYSDALYALLAPNSFETPPILELLADAQNETSRDRLWVHLKRISDFGSAYIAACTAAGTRPNWRVAMFPGED